MFFCLVILKFRRKGGCLGMIYPNKKYLVSVAIIGDANNYSEKKLFAEIRKRVDAKFGLDAVISIRSLDGPSHKKPPVFSIGAGGTDIVVNV